jgi:hypothetical protein
MTIDHSDAVLTIDDQRPQLSQSNIFRLYGSNGIPPMKANEEPSTFTAAPASAIENERLRRKGLSGQPA